MTEAPTQRHILLLDDEGSVLFALKLLLQALGNKVTDFSSPPDALKYLQDGGECDLFLSDLRMPILTGAEVLVAAKKIRPELPFVLMSGHATDDDIEDAKENGAIGFLGKPFRPDEIKEILKLI